MSCHYSLGPSEANRFPIAACHTGWVIRRSEKGHWIEGWYPRKRCTITDNIYVVTCQPCLFAIQKDVTARLGG